MSDYKTAYSEVSQHYVETVVPFSDVDQGRYERSKSREARHNDQWIRNPVNINEICDRFTPGDDGYREGVKFVFESDRYLVKADMASGYLRIYDKELRAYVKLDGTPGTLAETHFKILTREEM